VSEIYSQGSVAQVSDRLAMNFLMDRDADGWQRDLADLKKKVGDCETAAPVKAASALAGEFTWRCTHGRVKGSVLLAPTKPPRIQALSLDVATP
jgi:serine-type D-Ala-D-Ala carboxypeptidase/endopeptidase